VVEVPISGGLRRSLALWIDWITLRPGAVALAAALVSALALTYTVSRLTINTSTTEMIAADVPFRQNWIAYQRAFPQFSNPIVAVVDGDAPERVEAAAADLAGALGADPGHFAAVDYPGGDPFFARHGLLYLTVPALAELSDRLAAAQPLLAVLAQDPTLRGLAEFLDLAAGQDGALGGELDGLLADMAQVVDAQLAGEPRHLSWRKALQADAAPAATRALVLAQPRLDHTSLAPAAEAIAALREHAAALGITPAEGLELRLTGEAMLDHEELESVGSRALLAATISTVAVAILLVWGLGSMRLIAATLLTLAVGLIATAGLATLAVGRLNLISITFAVLFVGLGVDFGIHLVLRYREVLERHREQREAVRGAVLGVGGALSMSALCAALGFLSFVPTDYLGLAELGLISAGGMAIAWFTSLTLLPALLCLMPIAPRPLVTDNRRRWLPRTDRHARVVLGLAALGALASLLAVPEVEFDFNPLNLKDPSTESVATFYALAADPATSPHLIDVVADSLAGADAIAIQLETAPEVGEAVTLSAFVPDEQAAKLDLIDALAFYLGPTLEPGDPIPLSAPERAAALASLRTTLGDVLAARSKPDTDSGALQLANALDRLERQSGDLPAALAELEERLMGTLPALFERLNDALLAGPISLETLPAQLSERWVNDAGQARIQVRPAEPITDNRTLREFAQAVLAVEPSATGTPIEITEGADVVIDAFAQASWLALGLITLLLAVVLRSLRDIVLVLAPLGLAVLFTAATAVLLDLQLNFANVIVLPLLLGLGVSGALHVVMRARQHPGRLDVGATSTPRAVLFSALTTIASFGSLAVSDHRGLSSMGQLLTIAILWCLVCTLAVLPAMLSLTRRSGAR
jgi:hopanoid biosynthesis associated RND transporter like protein HpnN